MHMVQRLPAVVIVSFAAAFVVHCQTFHFNIGEEASPAQYHLL